MYTYFILLDYVYNDKTLKYNISNNQLALRLPQNSATLIINYLISTSATAKLGHPEYKLIDKHFGYRKIRTPCK